MDLLWENASQASEFAAQTVELDLSGYQFIFMDYLLINSQEYMSSCVIKAGGIHAIAELASSGGVLSGSPSINGRLITVKTTGIVFGNGMGCGSMTASFSQRNALIIPLRIFGINGVS